MHHIIYDIMRYYKYLIQKETEGSAVKDTAEDFGMYEMESKFYGTATVKDVAKRDWHDEDGDDEFVPSVQRYKAIDAEVKFGFKGDKYSANAAIKKFMEYLNGGTMKVYDEYNHIGRQNVRFQGISDDAELVRDKDGDILIIKVKLKINDPVTDIILTK